jgi:mRNA interferase MazF
MRRGEVRWYKFPKPDKNRPVLILTRTSILDYLGEVTVAPLTRTVRNIPSEVRLSSEDGVSTECAVNCDHLQTVSRGKIGALITTLAPPKMREVARAIAFTLDLLPPAESRPTKNSI